MQLRDRVVTGNGQTTTVLIICESKDPSGDVHVLMVHNNARDRKPEGWGLPGGGVRDGEAFASAAIRELQEETGIRLPEIPEPELLKNIRVSPNHSRVVFKYVGWLPFMEGSFLVDDPGEGVIEACWVSYHDINDAWRASQRALPWALPAVDSEGRRFYSSHLRVFYE